MGQASLTGYNVRRSLRFRFLKWRTVRNSDTAMRHLDTLAAELQRRGWRCVKTYSPEVVPVHIPLLRVYGADVAVTLCVLAVPGGRWAFHEAPRGRGGFLCLCGDGEHARAGQIVDGFLRDRSSGLHPRGR